MSKQLRRSSQITTIDIANGMMTFRGPGPKSTPKLGRKHLGSEIGEDLFGWLALEKSAAVNQVNEVLELLVELGELSRKDVGKKEHAYKWQGKIFTANPNVSHSGFSPNSSSRQDSLALRLNELLRTYVLAPHYWCTLGDWSILGLWAMNEGEEVDTGFSFDENDAIIAILELAREGLMSRVRRCHCGVWFFAKFPTHFSHTKKCRQDKYRASPEYKAMRREYMKNNRAFHSRHDPKFVARKT